MTAVIDTDIATKYIAGRVVLEFTPRSRFLSLLAVGLALLIAGTAQASQITCNAYDGANHTNTNSSNCAASGLNNSPQTATHTISVPVDQDTSIDMFDTFTLTQNISAFASGTLGTAHGLASVSGSNTPASYGYTSTYSLHDENGFTRKDANGDPLIVHFSVTDPNPLFYNMDAESDLQWADVITLFAPGAAPGTMLNFNISAPMTASVSSSDCTAGNAVALNTFAVENTVIIHGMAFFGGTTISSAGTFASACDPNGNGSLSSTFQAPVGSVLLLEGELKLRASGSGNGPSFSAMADASNTGHYHLDVLTPNAFYLDENGSVNGFASPQPQSAGVPEPGTVGMLCFGLVVMSVARRKRKP